jgi:hypothetical protein
MLRFERNLVVYLLVWSAGSWSCSRPAGDAAPAPSALATARSAPSATARASKPRSPTVAKVPTAAPPVDPRAARKTEYCSRHDRLRHLTSPKCQACLKGGSKLVASCKDLAEPFKACQRKVAKERQRDGLMCAASCGLACACSLDCYEKYQPECLDGYLTMIGCAELACESECK